MEALAAQKRTHCQINLLDLQVEVVIILRKLSKELLLIIIKIEDRLTSLLINGKFKS